MDRSYSVYAHKNKSNEKVYIGITGRKPEERWLNGHGYKNNIYFNKAIQKYGWDNFEHIVLAEGLTKDEAEQMEIKLILKYNATNQSFGYNIQNGGNSIGKHSEETKVKMSKSHMGMHHTNETKRKLSDIFTGRKLTDDWLKNRTLSQTGLKRNTETRKKISDKKSRPVICVNTRIIYKSLTDAAEKTNTQLSHISNCCNKKRPRAGISENGEGLFWMFYDEYISKNYDLKANSEIIPKLKIVCKKRPIKCVETGIIYDSVSEAHRKTNILKSSLSMCLNGKSKTAGKYHWIFADCEDI
ncbi:MAG: GIY-YIG nuclease family protein [Erysipelotrichaceae bacterium]|nr:GIY-YIG nuclease family protein [Erysipelotrichaceae bacterium]